MQFRLDIELKEAILSWYRVVPRIRLIFFH